MIVWTSELLLIWHFTQCGADSELDFYFLSFDSVCVDLMWPSWLTGCKEPVISLPIWLPLIKQLHYDGEWNQDSILPNPSLMHAVIDQVYVQLSVWCDWNQSSVLPNSTLMLAVIDQVYVQFSVWCDWNQSSILPQSQYDACNDQVHVHFLSFWLPLVRQLQYNVNETKTVLSPIPVWCMQWPSVCPVISMMWLKSKQCAPQFYIDACSYWPSVCPLSEFLVTTSQAAALWWWMTPRQCHTQSQFDACSVCPLSPVRQLH